VARAYWVLSEVGAFLGVGEGFYWVYLLQVLDRGGVYGGDSPHQNAEVVVWS